MVLLQTVKIDSESCTIIEDVIDEDQEVLEVWLIKFNLHILYCYYQPYGSLYLGICFVSIEETSF